MNRAEELLIALTVVCPACQAKPGDRCTRARNKTDPRFGQPLPGTQTHAERIINGRWGRR